MITIPAPLHCVKTTLYKKTCKAICSTGVIALGSYTSYCLLKKNNKKQEKPPVETGLHGKTSSRKKWEITEINEEYNTSKIGILKTIGAYVPAIVSVGIAVKIIT